jgi:hypothetical protein
VSEKIVAPWTPEQVAQLNRYQTLGVMHPFTCPRGHGDLTATPDGWVCSGCAYTQDWAHLFMADQETLDALQQMFGR